MSVIITIQKCDSCDLGHSRSVIVSDQDYKVSIESGWLSIHRNSVPKFK